MKRILWFLLIMFGLSMVAPEIEAATTTPARVQLGTPRITVAKRVVHKKKHRRHRHHRRHHHKRKK